MDLLDSVAFTLQQGSASSCPWLHSKAIDEVAQRLNKQAEETATHVLVNPGNLTALGEAVLGLAEMYHAIGEILTSVSAQVRRNAMAALEGADPQERDPGEMPTGRPSFTLLQGGLADEEDPEVEEIGGEEDEQFPG